METPKGLHLHEIIQRSKKGGEIRDFRACQPPISPAPGFLWRNERPFGLWTNEETLESGA